VFCERRNLPLPLGCDALSIEVSKEIMEGVVEILCGVVG
jgi:predicted solute-binding protein